MKKLFLVLALLALASHNPIQSSAAAENIEELRRQARHILYSAIRDNDVEDVRALLATNLVGANTPLLDEGNKEVLPLHFAANAGNWEMIAALLQHGALKDAQGAGGQTPRRIIQDKFPHLLTRFDRFERE